MLVARYYNEYTCTWTCAFSFWRQGNSIVTVQPSNTSMSTVTSKQATKFNEYEHSTVWQPWQFFQALLLMSIEKVNGMFWSYTCQAVDKVLLHC